MKGGIAKEDIYFCIRGLGGISECMLAMHANCFNEIWKSMIHDVGICDLFGQTQKLLQSQPKKSIYSEKWCMMEAKKY